MEQKKRQRLQAAGWRIGTTSEFLGLSPEESIYVELKVRLSDALKYLRRSRRMSQETVAVTVGSSQSRVAKMESNDPSVSLDLLITSLIAMGVSRQGLARIMGLDEPEPLTMESTADVSGSVIPGTFTLASAAENRPEAG